MVDDFGKIDFQEYGEDNGYLLNVEGQLPALDTISCGEQVSGSFEFDLWDDYDKQDNATAVGSGTISVGHRYIYDCADDYELIDIQFDEIDSDTVGVELTDEQKAEVEKKVTEAIGSRFSYVIGE